MYVGQTSTKLIGGGDGYNMMSMDVNVGQPSLMMDPSDCLTVRSTLCLSVCLSLCLTISLCTVKIPIHYA